MTVLADWKAKLGADWEKTYAASNTIYVARQNNVLFSVLAQFFGPEAINDRLLLIETISFTTTPQDMLQSLTRIIADRSVGSLFFGNYHLMDYELMGGDARAAIIAETEKRGMTTVLPPLVPFGSKQWPALVTPGRAGDDRGPAEVVRPAARQGRVASRCRSGPSALNLGLPLPQPNGTRCSARTRNRGACGAAPYPQREKEPFMAKASYLPYHFVDHLRKPGFKFSGGVVALNQYMCKTKSNGGNDSASSLLGKLRKMKDGEDGSTLETLVGQNEFEVALRAGPARDLRGDLGLHVPQQGEAEEDEGGGLRAPREEGRRTRRTCCGPATSTTSTSTDAATRSHPGDGARPLLRPRLHRFTAGL